MILKYTISHLIKQNGIYLDNITVNGKNALIEYYLNFNDLGEEIPAYTYQDHDGNNIAVLDVNAELNPKILAKGVFETIDLNTNNVVSIQFYKTLPLDLKETIELSK